MTKGKGTVYDIGHSTRSKEMFLLILKRHSIEIVVDVRRFPRSKKFPHFNLETMKEYLSKEGIEYLWMGEKLGGFRKGGYEEWSKTETFAQGIEELENLAMKKRTVILCAEGFYLRCHRRFILEKLTKSGWEVKHL
jgi:uncharacterized protein (DUF488 family)